MNINSINQQQSSQKPNFRSNYAVIKDGENWVSLTAGKTAEEIFERINSGASAQPLFLHTDELHINGKIKTKASHIPMIVTGDHISDLSVVQRFGNLAKYFNEKFGLSGITLKGKVAIDPVEAKPAKFRLYPTADKHQPKSNPNGIHADYSLVGSSYKNSL